jgi:hypothetical protein
MPNEPHPVSGSKVVDVGVLIVDLERSITRGDALDLAEAIARFRGVAAVNTLPADDAIHDKVTALLEHGEELA